jgi:hypothetical protein
MFVALFDEVTFVPSFTFYQQQPRAERLDVLHRHAERMV